MIILHGFGNKFGLVDISPFVVQVNLFLRIAGINFHENNHANNIKNAPKGKLPFITDTENMNYATKNDDGAALICDSAHIFEYLTNTYSVEVDNNLTKAQKAEGHLMIKTLNEHLYWNLLYSRWAEDATWDVIKKAVFEELPFPLKSFIPKLIRKNVLKSLYAQGIGRHTKEQVLSFTNETLQVFSRLLSDKRYIFGEKISSFDAVIYGHLSQFISPNIDNEFNLMARNFDNLVNYCQRIEQDYY